MASAPRCPIPGPCLQCTSREPHYCCLGAQELKGVELRAALAREMDELAFYGGLRRSREWTLEIVLGRCCEWHRRSARALLAEDRSRSSSAPDEPSRFRSS